MPAFNDIETLLDEITLPPLDGDLVSTAVKKDRYKEYLSSPFRLSHSTLQTLWMCPRRHELDKITAKNRHQQASTNVDFVMGHAIGSGIQTMFLTGDKQKALLETILAWSVGFDDQIERTKKNIWWALTAIDQFCTHEFAAFSEYELFEVDGRPAVELAFKLILPSNYSYYGHIDLVLRHRHTQELLVVEIKTTAFSNVHEAVYAHSPQTIGYSYVLQNFMPEEQKKRGVYTVLYYIYQTTNRQFLPMPFNKSLTKQVEWTTDIEWAISDINRYMGAQHFPKRSQGCFAFNRPCPYFGSCEMSNRALAGVDSLTDFINEEEEPISSSLIFPLNKLDTE